MSFDGKPTLFSLDELGARRELPARPAPEREPPPVAPRVFYEDEQVQLWHGRWQDVVPKLDKVDAVITDPPYGGRTHEGQRHGRKDPNYSPDACLTGTGLAYEAWTDEHVRELVEQVSNARGWFVGLTSHDLLGAYSHALEHRGRYVFAPLACVQFGMNVRLAGDGPSNWTVWAVVARPRTMRAWGTLPGAYVGGQDQDRKRGNGIGGGKPLWLMRELVRDYSRTGDIILDPCAGAGTTGRAAKDLGRRAILIEQDRRTCELAAKVLRPARAWQQELAPSEVEP